MYSHPATQQDVWVIDRLDKRRNGFYVEVGAHNGLHHSNTLLLEWEYGWTGLLIEPQPRLFEELSRNRPNNRLDSAAIGCLKSACFFLAGSAYGGLTSEMPKEWRKEHKRRNTPEIIVPTLPLNDVLRQHKCPRLIDYLSLDVEGAELMILNEFMRDPAYQFLTMTVEFRYDKCVLDQLEQILAPMYVLERVQGFDAFFVNRALSSRRAA